MNKCVLTWICPIWHSEWPTRGTGRNWDSPCTYCPWSTWRCRPREWLAAFAREWKDWSALNGSFSPDFPLLGPLFSTSAGCGLGQAGIVRKPFSFLLHLNLRQILSWGQLCHFAYDPIHLSPAEYCQEEVFTGLQRDALTLPIMLRLNLQQSCCCRGLIL